MLDNVKTTLTGYARYRGEGHYVFLLHRLTGLGTLMFLTIHILDTAIVYFFPDKYNDAMALYQATPFMLGEIGLVFCVVFHGVNGLRIAWFDLYKPEYWNRETEHKAARAVVLTSLALWLPAAVIMTYNLLHYNFGLFGG